jgi:hypothetical protein
MHISSCDEIRTVIAAAGIGSATTAAFCLFRGHSLMLFVAGRTPCVIALGADDAVQGVRPHGC